MKQDRFICKASGGRTAGNGNTSAGRCAVWPLVQQVGRDAVRYGIVGTGAVVADYLTFIVLAHGMGISAPAAQAVSRAAGGLAGFSGHRFWTFRYRAGPDMAGPFVRFWLVWVVMYVLSIGAIAAAMHWFPNGPVRAKLMADVSVGVFAFAVQRHWTFRKRSEGDGRPAGYGSS